MNDDPAQPTPDPVTRTDALISRVVDRTAAPGEFEHFLVQAERAPEPLRQLVLALRDDCALLAGVEAELDAVGEVPAPVGRPRLSTAGEHDGRGNLGWRGWSGWAAAALLATCWIGSAGWLGPARGSGEAPRPGASQSDESRPGLDMLADAPVAPTDTLQPEGLMSPPFGDYAPRPRLDTTDVAHGRVLGELPLQLVSTRRAADGPGYDVVVVRRVLEQSRVDNVLSLGADDSGRPAPVLVDPAVLAKASSF